MPRGLANYATPLAPFYSTLIPLSWPLPWRHPCHTDSGSPNNSNDSNSDSSDSNGPNAATDLTATTTRQLQHLYDLTPTGADFSRKRLPTQSPTEPPTMESLKQSPTKSPTKQALQPTPTPTQTHAVIVSNTESDRDLPTVMPWVQQYDIYCGISHPACDTICPAPMYCGSFPRGFTSFAQLDLVLPLEFRR